MEREKRFGYSKNHVCNIMKPRALYLLIEKKYRLW